MSIFNCQDLLSEWKLRQETTNSKIYEIKLGYLNRTDSIRDLTMVVQIQPDTSKNSWRCNGRYTHYIQILCGAGLGTCSRHQHTSNVQSTLWHLPRQFVITCKFHASSPSCRRRWPRAMLQHSDKERQSYRYSSSSSNITAHGCLRAHYWLSNTLLVSVYPRRRECYCCCCCATRN